MARPPGKGIRLGSLSFGKNKKQADRITKRMNNNADKFVLYIAIYKRLAEYKELGILSKMISPHENDSTLWNIWRDYKYYASISKINHQKYDLILEEIGLPKIKK